MNAEANSEIETAIEWCLTHAGRGLAAELAQDAARVLREKWATSTPGQCGPLAYVISTALHVGAETAIAWAEGQDRRLRREPPTAADPTPRERGQNTCRAALMTVIGLHRRENTLGPDMARAIVDATQALMDLDGLRAGEAAALDVAKERDDARALAEGLTRGQDDLRRKLAAMEAERDATAAERDRVVEANAALRKLHHGALAGLEEMTGRRDLAMQDRDAARERMSKAEAEAVILQERLAAFRRGMDADITLDAGHSAPGNPTADAVTAPIGRRLADARLAVFATTATAAPAAGMTQGRLKNLEAGVLLPDPDDLQRLARAYGQPEISGWSVPVRYLEERGLPQTTATSATTARKRTAEIVAEYGEHLGLDAPAAPVVVTRSSGRQQERP